MLAIVMLELTGDAGMIAPVGIVCIVSMIVGNQFNHGLYHGLIPLMNIPFLNSVPAQVMYVTRVNTIMSNTLVTLPVKCCFQEIQIVFKRMQAGHLTHSAFPVVENDYDLHLVGLLEREHMKQMIEDMKDPVTKQRLLDKEGKIDLMEYCDRSPLAVTAMTTVARAYEMFRKLGLRHLMVLGGRGEVVGVITRKDLMVFRILHRKQRELDLIVKMQRTVRQIFNNMGWYENGGQDRQATKEKYNIDEIKVAWKSQKRRNAMVDTKSMYCKEKPTL
jgi:predicted transcriptional regulator